MQVPGVGELIFGLAQIHLFGVDKATGHELLQRLVNPAQTLPFNQCDGEQYQQYQKHNN
jgi:hypothetical protein